MYRMLLRRMSSVSFRLPGYELDKEARTKLVALYRQTLEGAGQVPADSAYRKNVENITQFRLKIVESGASEEEVEQKVGGGKFEEMLHQAEWEYQLLQDMTKEKPWEGDAKSIKIDLID